MKNVAECLGIVAMLSLASMPASAATYTYTGQTFTAIDDPPYTKSMSISGYFEVASPLLAYTDFADISGDVTAYSFSDGAQSISVKDSSAVFQVATNALAEIISWIVLLEGNSGEIYISSSLGDYGSFGNSPSIVARTGASRIGTWRTDVAAIPLPAAAPLLGVGLAGLGMIGWVRKRKRGA